MKKIYLFLFSLTFFSFLIFILSNYFFWTFDDKIIQEAEEIYIEPSIINDISNTKKDIENDDLLINENIELSLNSAYNIDFTYIPENFINDSHIYTNILKIFLNSNYINNIISDLSIELNKDKYDVRWKMKNRSIKLFWIKLMNYSEYTAVAIHELSHFIDIYILKKWLFNDVSNYFYVYSWNSTKIIKPWQSIEDFVSGYAMTNKYEDFSESFTYFMLHNADFLEKTKNSKVLKWKYDFFNKYLFKNKGFSLTDFSVDNKIELYYRDITKIDFSIKNFLIFIKKWI